jgi:hypothetical protein
MEVLYSFVRSGRIALFVTLATAFFTAGCGTPGAPQPPSLNLPTRVEDLRANRTGNEVSLAWSMPKKTTDKLFLKGGVLVQVCRKLPDAPCSPVGGGLQVAPGSDGAFSETLPQSLVSGAPRVLSYFVELKNRNSRSAGLSNPAVVLAGEAPAPVAGLTAEVHKDGVVLRWAPDAATLHTPSLTAIRLHRKLLTPVTAKPKAGLLVPQPEPVEQSLLVEPGGDAVPAEPADHAPSRALDKQIQFGQTYEYRAQRLARVSVDGKTLELAGELSSPVRIEASDIFPPAVPTDLAAVATVVQGEAEVAIDLSWQPVADPDLAGYAVYRREGEAAWHRISPALPLVGPAFRDTQVQPGHTYRYAVTSIDQGGHESARSAETQENTTNP